ncbi:MAG TPA: DUF4091 domain-containing protein [Thermoplasmatales archaeon]|nr:DUF4091 domain-containing protein [Thermoplasmatales archaeon]
MKHRERAGIKSMRLKTIRDGFENYEYLRLQ